MKATDLMIGDWVNYQPGDTPQYMKVGMVSGYDIQLDLYREGGIEVAAQVWFDEENYIQPIPLTPEILEKNGFDQWTGSGDSTKMCQTPFGEEGMRYILYVGLQKKTIEIHCAPPIERTPGWRKCNKVYLEVCGCFVHELQHALRLCGIKKEIAL